MVKLHYIEIFGWKKSRDWLLRPKEAHSKFLGLHIGSGAANFRTELES